MKKIFSSALVLGLALGLNSAIFAQDNNSQNSAPNAQEKIGRKNRMGKTRDGRRGDRNAMIGGLNRVNLTDAQKQQIQNLRRNNPANQATREEMRELAQAQRSGTLTTAQQARLNTLREQNRAQAEKMQQQVLAILTPEQREQLEQTRQGRRDGVSERRGNNRAEGRSGGNGAERRGGRFQGVNLTDAQKEQLRNLRTNNNSNDAARQEMRQLAQAKRSGTLTAEQKTRLKTLRAQVKADGEKRQQQISSVLTPEQREQLEKAKAERKERRGQRTQNNKNK